MIVPYSLQLALAAGLVALALTPLARALAIRVGAMDVPDARRVHDRPMPRFGGLAIAAGVLGVAWLARLLPGPAAALEPRPLLGLTFAAIPILALGMADDRWSVSPWVKLAVQACAALTLTVFGYGVPLLTNPLGPPIELGLLNVPVTLLWVLTVTNAINLIDGLDGLASGVVVIASAALWTVARMHADFYVMFFAALLIGACAGFLRWNFPPARVFMGDTGSQFLGLTLSAVSLLENRKGTAAVTLLLPLVALGVPLADSAIAFLRRAVRRQHVFRGDTGHVHHQLLQAGLSKRGALFAMWALCAFFGTIAVLLTWLPREWSAVLVALLAAVLFVTLELLRALRHDRRDRAAAREAAREAGSAAAKRSPRRR
ncbi:MAG: undecaprenyl/decaprenyl-phosphate alpha-N-acetylglucosaminyl 1-phosphate transferase [Candidatus Eisenbacteria bacterium]|uniref:Undecaprenyl/decaprenyl-phosphate alpha-N-acetylglucosaminyl 1-phosphate transferase n=1 Tax=Eiseniibacteriota bacterium TaxID=2212470 RepID=A0A933W850_UNCEI|nr:undecaprenyl/decaprenyl-phosphate alpha-N-acetylglucosaminyl 1-phosphate transferase [Candidatus Eisenbacteria bacterium]